MKRKDSFHFIFAMLLTLFMKPSLALAQDNVFVQASLSRERVFVGDELAYVIEVLGATDPQIGQLDLPQGISMVSHGRTTQTTSSVVFENGQRKQVRQRRYLYQFTITANTDGEFTIPAPTIQDRGEKHIGNETSFRSVLPSESLDDELIISIDRTRLYQNETIELECVWWLGDNTSQFNFGSSKIPESLVIRPGPTSGNAQSKLEFPLNGQMITGYVSRGIHNGSEKSSFTFRLSITPTELGTLEIGPFRSLFTRQPSFGDRYRAYIESNSLKIDVVPVPEHGKPAIYDGAIGEFQLEARASNSSVRVGDPIELTLRIQGQEPMTGVRDAPDLATHPGFAEQFKTDSDGWREITPRRDGTRIYQTTIRALSDSVKEIPPIQLASFDPDQGLYRIFSTDPIALRVEDVKEVTLADAVVSGNQVFAGTEPTRPSVERVELSPAAPGLWAHTPIEEMTQREGFNVAQALKQPVWVATFVAPPSLYFAMLGVLAYRRGRDKERVRLSCAFRQARKREGINSLRTYTSDVLNIAPEAFVASDVHQLQITNDLLMELEDAFMQEEQPHGSTVRKESVHSDLLKRLHSQLLANTRVRSST